MNTLTAQITVSSKTFKREAKKFIDNFDSNLAIFKKRIEKRLRNELLENAPKTKGILFWKRNLTPQERLDWVEKEWNSDNEWGAGCYAKETFLYEVAFIKRIKNQIEKVFTVALKSKEDEVFTLDVTLWRYIIANNLLPK